MKLKKFERLAETAVGLTLYVSSVEDIWHLYNLITIGDTVRAKTQRKIVKDTGASTATERKVMVLSLQVTHAPVFDPVGILRISGVNRTECEWVRLGAAHTTDIAYDPPCDIKMIKQEWDTLCDARLAEACDEDAKADSAAVVMENGLAFVCLVNGAMCITKQKIDTSISRKRRGDSSARDNSVSKFYQV